MPEVTRHRTWYRLMMRLADRMSRALSSRSACLERASSAQGEMMPEVTPELPPLPEPERVEVRNGYGVGHSDAAMQAYARAAVLAEREKIAAFVQTQTLASIIAKDPAEQEAADLLEGVMNQMVFGWLAAAIRRG